MYFRCFPLSLCKNMVPKCVKNSFASGDRIPGVNIDDARCRVSISESGAPRKARALWAERARQMERARRPKRLRKTRRERQAQTNARAKRVERARQKERARRPKRTRFSCQHMGFSAMPVLVLQKTCQNIGFSAMPVLALQKNVPKD